MAREALARTNPQHDIRTVDNGEELLDYLYQRGEFSSSTAPRPSLILLDLNMPRLDGREALAAIKEDRALRAIPVVVLTTSCAEEDVNSLYDLGANSYITKPVSDEALHAFARVLSDYWFHLVTLPEPGIPHIDA